MRLKTYILLRLLTLLAAVGCGTVYAVIWRVIGLPLGLWAAAVTAVLGVGSVWGLVEWITRQRTEAGSACTTPHQSASLTASPQGEALEIAPEPRATKCPWGATAAEQPRNDMVGSACEAEVPGGVMTPPYREKGEDNAEV